MEECSITEPLCFGTVYIISTGTCWYKNDTFTYKPSAITNTSDSILAVPKAGALDPQDTTCQFQNNSIQASASSENFTIHCGLDVNGGGYSPSNAPVVGAPYHAKNLSDCMEQCSQASPFCKAVAYNPGMGVGYANCYPKSSVPSLGPGGSPDGPNDRLFLRHSAVAQDPPPIDDPCQTTGQAVTSTKGTSYGLACDQDRGGNDFSKYFESTLQSCIDRCDQESTTNCLGVIFDTELTSGWENCYLKNGTGIANNGRTGFVFARRDGQVEQKSKSKAWIAGPVIGGLAAVAILGAFWWYFQRKRKRTNYAPVNGAAAAEAKMNNHENNTPHYPSGYEQQQAYGWPQQQQWNGTQQWDAKHEPDPSYEMEARDVRPEMPGSQMEPTELPTSPVPRPGVHSPGSVQSTPIGFNRR